MKPLRTLLLAGIALPLVMAVATTASAQVPPPGGPGAEFCRPGPDGQPPVLSPEQRVTCAEQAVDRAQRQLDRITRQDGDTSEAEQRLADAEAELVAAQEALAAAEAEPPAEEEVATPPPEELPPQEEIATPPPEELPPEEEVATPPSEELPPAPPDEGSTVELQLQKQGDTEGIDRIRKLRAKLRRDSGPDVSGTGEPGDDATAPGQVPPSGDNQAVINLDGQVIIRQSEGEETDRLLYGARDADVDELPNGFTRSTITREDGTKIVTTHDASGQIVKRVRIDRRGKQFVMIDDSGYNQGPGTGGPGGPSPGAYRFDLTLPPLRVQIPKDQYVVETRRASRRQIEQALIAPPVERAERLYSLDEVRYSQRLRDKVRRIDVDTITFDFGSAAISPSQFGALTELGEALREYLFRFPWATILVEGHTDAVGTDYANLILSNERAVSVTVALTSYFDIPPENLVPQGYGEQFLKIDTQLPERENRRVTLRNITGLVQGEF